MKNDSLDALLRRDESVQTGLEVDRDLYAPIEDEVKPLREQHAANLLIAQQLEQEVFEADSDDSASQKKGTRGKLNELGGRIAAGVRAYATVKARKDGDAPDPVAAADATALLRQQARFTLRELRHSEEGEFVLAIGGILSAAAPLAAQLAKWEITAEDLAQAAYLLLKFQNRKGSPRLADVQGATARKLMTKALRANSILVKEMRELLAPYKGTAREKALTNFNGYAKVILQKGGGGKADQPAA